VIGFAMPPEWMEDGLCAQVGPSIFYPKRGGSVREAKAVCAECPVIEQCLAYALDLEAGNRAGVDGFVAGVWGGLSESERRAIIREQRKAS
jgi:WhiB family redox-sensing transcriptional regulator